MNQVQDHPMVNSLYNHNANQPLTMLLLATLTRYLGKTNVSNMENEGTSPLISLKQTSQLSYS